MVRLLFLSVFLMFFAGCTTTRWVVTEEYALDNRDKPRVLSSKTILLLETNPSIENPVASFAAYQVTEKEYQQRVKVERTVQKYRPRWGYVVLGTAGAAFSALAANTDVIMPSASVSQKIALNLAGITVGALSFLNMEPTGEPIFTGEAELMRRSGTEVLQDSTRISALQNEFRADLSVYFEGDEIFSQTGLSLADGSLDINLASFSDRLSDVVNEESKIDIQLAYEGKSAQFEIPVRTFLAPYVHVTVPVVFLRNAPVPGEMNVITEIAEGSFLELIRAENENWFRVRYGGSETFIRRSAGEIRWRSEIFSGPALVFEFTDVPFGDIDVENRVPVLKEQKETDRALLLTNSRDNRISRREYLERDQDLFRFYMRSALQMGSSQVTTIEVAGEQEWVSRLGQIPEMEGDGSLVVYITAEATVRQHEERPSIVLVHKDEEGRSEEVPFSLILEQLRRISPGALFLFADMEFHQTEQIPSFYGERNGNGTVLQDTAGSLLRELPNSVIIFSNRPNQQSSLYTGDVFENKRHHIFTYFWAEALQQRKTVMADLIRHLENNVDYTSRRLHDRPQEIQAFGNFTLDIAQ